MDAVRPMTPKQTEGERKRSVELVASIFNTVLPMVGGFTFGRGLMHTHDLKSTIIASVGSAMIASGIFGLLWWREYKAPHRPVRAHGESTGGVGDA